MTTRRGKRWRAVAVLAGLAAAVAAACVAVEIYTREPPNYDEVEPGLWVGGNVDAPPPRTRAVLNVCEMKDPYEGDIEAYRHRPIKDAAPAPSLDWLREQVAFIDAQRRDGKVVYVHCAQGVSRSVTVATAYLMRAHDIGRDEALARVKGRRKDARPNPAFRELLAEWEKQLGGGR